MLVTECVHIWCFLNKHEHMCFSLRQRSMPMSSFQGALTIWVSVCVPLIKIMFCSFLWNECSTNLFLSHQWPSTLSCSTSKTSWVVSSANGSEPPPAATRGASKEPSLSWGTCRTEPPTLQGRGSCWSPAAGPTEPSLGLWRTDVSRLWTWARDRIAATDLCTKGSRHPPSLSAEVLKSYKMYPQSHGASTQCCDHSILSL